MKPQPVRKLFRPALRWVLRKEAGIQIAGPREVLLLIGGPRFIHRFLERQHRCIRHLGEQQKR